MKRFNYSFVIVFALLIVLLTGTLLACSGEASPMPETEYVANAPLFEEVSLLSEESDASQNVHPSMTSLEITCCKPLGELTVCATADDKGYLTEEYKSSSDFSCGVEPSLTDEALRTTDDDSDISYSIPSDNGDTNGADNGIIYSDTGDDTSSANGEVNTPEPSQEDGVSDSEGEVNIPDSEAGEPNIFEALFQTIKEYATEIFSLLAFVVSLILTYMYKSGLTPTLKNALTNFGNLLGGVRESVSENERISREVSELVDKRLMAAENTITTLTENISSIEELIKKEEETRGEKMKLSEVLSMQIDMMYSIFMSSALPEYQKEAVAKKIEAMKELTRGEIK